MGIVHVDETAAKSLLAQPGLRWQTTQASGDDHHSDMMLLAAGQHPFAQSIGISEGRQLAEGV